MCGWFGPVPNASTSAIGIQIKMNLVRRDVNRNAREMRENIAK